MAFLGIKVPHEVGRILKKIDVPGKKEPDSEYHITIAFFGDDWPVSDAAKTLEATFESLKEFKPFMVKAQKVSCFPKGGNGVPIIARMESEELHKLEKKLKGAYDKEDIEFSKVHKEFKPHITLSYSDKEIDEEKIDTVEFMVHEIVLWCGDNGDDRLFVTFPLDGKKKKTSFLINKTNVFYALAKNPQAFFKQTTDRRKVARMSTIEQARAAKIKIAQSLNRPSWLRGIGIAKNDSGYCVKINVEKLTNAVKAVIPQEVDGVSVIMEEVGNIVAY